MPVQVFTSSPIHGSAPEGVTPKTGESQDGQANTASPPTVTTATTSSEQHGSLAAQLGARPHLPAQTGAPHSPSHSRYQPTQTQPTCSSPPPPQPGAVPSPGAGRSVPIIPIPPPPRTGEAAPSSSASASYPAPHAPRSIYGNKQSYLRANDGERTDYSHPPGYQQNAHAADFSSAQLAAHQASSQAAPSPFTPSTFGEEESAWDMAKKWVAAAGNTIATVENEIWKRINGD